MSESVALVHVPRTLYTYTLELGGQNYSAKLAQLPDNEAEVRWSLPKAYEPITVEVYDFDGPALARAWWARRRAGLWLRSHLRKPRGLRKHVRRQKAARA